MPTEIPIAFQRYTDKDGETNQGLQVLQETWVRTTWTKNEQETDNAIQSTSC